MPNRRRGLYKVKFNGGSLKDVGDISAAISSFEFIETEDKPDTIKFKVENVSESFISDPRTVEGATVEAQIGYFWDLVSIGTFKLERPKLTFPADGTMSFDFVGEKVSDTKLSNTEVRYQFKNKTDSQMAEAIAKMIGLDTTDVDPDGKTIQTITQTDKIYDIINITKLSWMQFLQDRAKIWGFQAYTKNNALYFGPIKDREAKDESNNPITLVYKKGGKGTLISFTMKDKGKGKAQKSNATGIDDRTGKSFDKTGDAVPKEEGAKTKAPDSVAKDPEKVTMQVFEDIYNPVTKKHGKRLVTKTVSKAAQVKNSATQTVEEQPETFQTHEANASDKQVADQMANAKSQASAWSIQGTAVPAVGLPSIRKGTTVFLEGIGIYSGKFLVTGTSHKIGSGYGMSFDCKTYSTSPPKESTGKKGSKQGTPPKENKESKPQEQQKKKKKKKSPVQVTPEVKGQFNVLTQRVR